MKPHAKLSASGAHRWMECPGSVALEDNYPDKESKFSAEGTIAHEYAELALKRGVREVEISLSGDGRVHADDRGEMLRAVSTYAEFVEALEMDIMRVERRVDFSRWVPDGFGTADCYGVRGNDLFVVDFKYGKGVRVGAENNPQGRLYALGVLSELDFLYDIKQIHIFIVQPRIDHVSDETLSRDSLVDWGETEVRRAASRVFESSPELCPGDKQCRFCKASGDCPAVAEKALSIAAEGFDDLSSLETQPTLKDVEMLTEAQIAQALKYKPLITRWLSSLEDTAMQRFKEGKSIEGFKVVEGRANRKWSDENEVLAAARAMQGVKISEVTEQKLLSPSNLEKKLGKDHKLISRFVVSPRGKPTVVPLSDKRPALDLDLARGFEALD